MKNYKKPIIEEEQIELEDIIATSGPSINDIFDFNNDGDGEDL
ncbi:MAG: hypothetical protein ACI35S_09065 [Anaeroplasma sp.]